MPFVCLVHVLGEGCVDASDPTVELLLACDDGEMDVVAHDGVRKATPVALLDRASEEGQIEGPLALGGDEPLAIDEARDEMVDEAGDDSPRLPRHGRAVGRWWGQLRGSYPHNLTN